MISSVYHNVLLLSANRLLLRMVHLAALCKSQLEQWRGKLNMATKLDPRQVVTFEELLRAMMYETEAVRRVLVWKRLVDPCPRWYGLSG